MTDFLDRFGMQLAAAERQLAVAPARPRSRRRPRRGAILALAGLALAVPALAATQPWEPILGRPALNDTPAGVSSSPVPSEEAQLLGVLRRPQNDDDRGPAAQKLLAGVGQEYKGVRLASVRLLTAPNGRQALLVPSEQHGISPEPGKYEVANDLCIELGSGGFCGTAEQIRSGSLMGGADDDSLLGIVPDGVARVALTFPNGQTLTSAVHDNFFWVTGVPFGERTIKAPPGHGSTPPLPPMRVPEQPKLKWFDSDGDLIGPPGAMAG